MPEVSSPLKPDVRHLLLVKQEAPKYSKAPKSKDVDVKLHSLSGLQAVGLRENHLSSPNLSFLISRTGWILPALPNSWGCCRSQEMMWKGFLKGKMLSTSELPLPLSCDILHSSVPLSLPKMVSYPWWVLVSSFNVNKFTNKSMNALTHIPHSLPTPILTECITYSYWEAWKTVFFFFPPVISAGLHLTFGLMHQRL